jgi:hypothetical protein
LAPSRKPQKIGWLAITIVWPLEMRTFWTILMGVVTVLLWALSGFVVPMIIAAMRTTGVNDGALMFGAAAGLLISMAILGSVATLFILFKKARIALFAAAWGSVVLVVGLECLNRYLHREENEEYARLWKQQTSAPNVRPAPPSEER